MSYKSARAHEIRSQNIRMARELVERYDPNKKTVILLPGGLGSRLERTKKPYSDNSPGPFTLYERIWMDWGIIFDEDALTMEIKSDGRDKGNRIVRANGPLNFLVEVYDGTEKFFNERGYNYLGYGFDWRRPLLESAMWLEDFLTRFKNGVIAQFNGDKNMNPLPKTTLICHSHGGLVAALFLQRVFSGMTNVTPKKVNQWIDNVITVGTPFYANAGHIRRYYKGEDALNIFYGTDTITRIAGTMPGPYIFLFLDKDTYDKDGAKLGLTRYPVRDAQNQNVEIDPYADSTLSRYPDWVNPEFLKKAKKERLSYRKVLPKAVRDSIYHLRGVRKTTGVEWLWKNIDGSTFDPENDKLPITNVDGEGDGTVPKWAARLAQVPGEQVYDLKVAQKHLDLMEHEETLNVMRFILDNDRLPLHMTLYDKKYIGIKRASRSRTDHFLRGIKQGTVNIQDDVASDPAIWRGIMEDINI